MKRLTPSSYWQTTKLSSCSATKPTTLKLSLQLLRKWVLKWSFHPSVTVKSNGTTTKSSIKNVISWNAFSTSSSTIDVASQGLTSSLKTTSASCTSLLLSSGLGEMSTEPSENPGTWAFSLRLKRASVHYDSAMSRLEQLLGNEQIKSVLVLIITWVGIIVPFFAAVDNFTPGGAADTYGLNPLVTPAPYAFLIWAPIYLGLLALAVYQALPDQQDDPLLTELRPWLALTAVLNAIWLYSVAAGGVWLPVITIFAL